MSRCRKPQGKGYYLKIIATISIWKIWRDTTDTKPQPWLNFYQGTVSAQSIMSYGTEFTFVTKRACDARKVTGVT